jgi:hypothetical protein
VDELMRILEGRTPDGYSLLVERDERGRWVATVEGVSRSRNASLEAALLEAAGVSARRWAAPLAAMIVARSVSLSEQAADGFRTRAS